MTDIREEFVSDEPLILNKSDNTENIGNNVSFLNILLIAFNLSFPLFTGQNIGLISYDFNIQKYFAQKLHIEGDRVPSLSWALVNAPFTVFGMIGSFTMSWAVNKYGRKYSTMFCILMGMIGEIFLILSYFLGRLELLGISRGFVGYSSAGGMVAGLCLLFELSPPRYKPIFNPLVQVFVTIGIFISGVMTLDKISGDNWYIIGFPPLAVSFFYLFVLFYMPDTPAYLIQKNKESEALNSLKRCRKDKQLIEEEMIFLTNYSRSQNLVKKMSLRDVFNSKPLIVPMVVCIFIHTLQQLSGINAVVAYAGTFFVDANFKQADIACLIVLSVGLVGSVIFSPFAAKCRRRLLFIISHTGMCLAFLVGYISWLLKATVIVRIVSLCFYVLIFQLGPGLLIWIITFEIFPQNASGALQGICTGVNWFANTLVYICYPIINNAINFHVSVIFIVTNLITCFYYIFIVVETYGSTPEQVIELYGLKFKSRNH